LEQTINLKKAQNRVHILDALRGLAIVAMVAHHLLFVVSEIFYDPAVSAGLLAFFKWCRGLYFSLWMQDGLQLIFQILFILISGAACRYSRSNLKRGVRVFIFALLLSVITCYILPAINEQMFGGVGIKFGILHFLGAVMIIWALTGRLFDKLCGNKIFNLSVPILFPVLFLFLYIMSEQTYDIHGLFWLGFANSDFVSADYFPIAPWIFIFFLGAWLGKYIQRGAFPKRFYQIRVPPLEFFGRHTLLIYVLHQPVILGLCYLIFVIIL